MLVARDEEIQEFLNQKNFKAAEDRLKGRILKDPNDADAYYLLGVSYYFQGQVGQTIQNLKKALSIEPKHTDAAICLSVLLNDLGQYDEAKKVFEQANHSVVFKKEGVVSSIDQKFAVKHLELGDLYFRYRRYDESIDEYTKAALLNPHHYDIRIRRAKAYARKGFVSRALQDLQTLKHEKPNYVPAQIQLGLLYFSQGNLIDAELEWETALKLHPGNREIQSYLDMARQTRNSSTPSATHSTV